jgi:hypothetical protein
MGVRAGRRSLRKHAPEIAETIWIIEANGVVIPSANTVEEVLQDRYAEDELLLGGDGGGI